MKLKDLLEPVIKEKKRVLINAQSAHRIWRTDVQNMEDLAYRGTSFIRKRQPPPNYHKSLGMVIL